MTTIVKNTLYYVDFTFYPVDSYRFSIFLQFVFSF